MTWLLGDELVFGGAQEPHDRWQVIYLDEPSSALKQTPGPRDDPDERPPARELGFEPEWTISEDLKSRKSDAECEAFIEAREALIGSYGGTHHRLLGHPQPIQGGLESGAETTLRQMDYGKSLSNPQRTSAKRNWRSLLQLDEEDDLNWRWGDGGRMHFMIRNRDLQQLRFDSVMAELQCH